MSDNEELRAGLQTTCHMARETVRREQNGVEVRSMAQSLLNLVCTPLSETIGTYRFHGPPADR